MITGSCLCAEMKFEISGELTPIQYCHAQRCRKATGSAFAPELLVAIDDLKWIAGEILLTQYKAPLQEEPPVYARGFCKLCGSPMPVVIEASRFYIINAGVLDSDPDVRPFRHAFVGQKACWHEITDNLPVYEDQPPNPKAYGGKG